MHTEDNPREYFLDPQAHVDGPFRFVWATYVRDINQRIVAMFVHKKDAEAFVETHNKHIGVI